MYHGGIPISFSWRSYLDLAKELDNGSNEAKQRSSISRAYYAAFCSARNHMEEKDNHKLPLDGSEHQYIIEYYMGYKKRRTTRNRTKIAQELKRMKRERIKADYDNILNERSLPTTVKDVLIRSDRVVSLIEAGGL